VQELNKIIRTFLENEVKFTIDTDGPELLQTTMKEEIAILLDNEIVNFKEMNIIIENGFKNSFISSQY
jgi:adenosine deaminase